MGANITVAGTKEALINAAGPLFAELGLKGTSVRAIAKSGHANIAAISYHFGSKENLYVETVRHVLTQTRCPLAEELLSHREGWMGDPEKRAATVYRLVEERVGQYFPGQYPHWYGRLMIRLMLQPTAEIANLFEEMMVPDFERLRDVLRCCQPALTDEDAQMWAHSLISQISHYIFTGDMMRMIPALNTGGSLQQRVVRHVSRAMIAGLNLPLPDFLAE